MQAMQQHIAQLQQQAQAQQQHQQQQQQQTSSASAASSHSASNAGSASTAAKTGTVSPAAVETSIDVSTVDKLLEIGPFNALDPAAELRAQKMREAYHQQITQGAFCYNEAKELGLLDNPDLKLKTAFFIPTQHEWVCIDADKRNPETGKIVSKAHLFGKCVNCEVMYDEARLKDNDQVGGLYYCANSAAKRQFYSAGTRRDRK